MLKRTSLLVWMGSLVLIGTWGCWQLNLPAEGLPPELMPVEVPATLPATNTPQPTRTPLPTPMPSATPLWFVENIGWSGQRRPLEAYIFGSGNNSVVMVGGMHGGYEWNTIRLAYEMIAYFQENREQVPSDVTLYIIPNANPDGLYLVSGARGDFDPSDIATNRFLGRFNSRGVDLNRNWGCNWSAEAVWRNEPVNAGNHAFSEPETRALRQFFIETPNIQVVVFWHSMANLISAGRCGDEAHEPSVFFTRIYGEAAGYPSGGFSAYPITGDASNWLAGEGIASFSVELKTRDGLDWEENMAGMLALLQAASDE